MPGGVADFAEVCVRRQEGAVKLPLDERTAADISLSGDVMLHFSGYGYARRGAPLWLLKKLEADRPGIRRLGVYFHELYAFGPPWGSSFWLSPVQRYVARRLAELSDFWMTSREQSAQWLRKHAGDKPNMVLPVFSTVGEMPDYLPQHRERIVVFGGPVVRAATYRAAGEALLRWAAAQEMDIDDIGPPMDDSLANAVLARAGARVHGHLPPEQAGQLLADASFGLIDYSAEALGKSSIFAAYCAHGVCPVVQGSSTQAEDGLRAGEHFISGLPESAAGEETIVSIGRAAWEWYQPHNIAAHIDAQHRLMYGTH